MTYSIFSVVANAFAGQKLWRPAWRDATPKPASSCRVPG
jgi:hypothetical protein